MKTFICLMLALMLISANARPQGFGQFPQRPVRPTNPVFGGNNAANNRPFIGQGTAIANPSAGGTGIAIGLGAAAQSPLGGFAIGQGGSTSTGK